VLGSRCRSSTRQVTKTSCLKRARPLGQRSRYVVSADSSNSAAAASGPDPDIDVKSRTVGSTGRLLCRWQEVGRTWTLPKAGET
jgi:hypothetical protein